MKRQGDQEKAGKAEGKDRCPFREMAEGKGNTQTDRQ